MGNNLVAVNVGTGRTINQVFAGLTHTCVVRDTDDVVCFGYGDAYDAVLGNGNTNIVGLNQYDMGDNLTRVELGTGLQVQTGVSSSFFSCVILTTGDVKCWGGNDNGQLGQGHTTSPVGAVPGDLGDNLPKVNLGTGRTAKKLFLGGSSACAIRDTDDVVCWGSNTYGMCGIGVDGDIETTVGSNPYELGDNLTAVNLGTGKTAKNMCMGYQHSCVILNTDEIVCWGRNRYGQLGRGDTTSTVGESVASMGDNLVPVNLGTGRTPKDIACGWESTCVLTTSDDVLCWGRNFYGQLGIGSRVNKGQGADDMGDNLTYLKLGGRKVKSLWGNAGARHYCAVLNGTEREIVCWGRNRNGQLGIGHNGNMGDQSTEMDDDLKFVILEGDGRSPGLA